MGTVAGIEKMAVYPGSMYVRMDELVAHREQNVEEVVTNMMIDERSVNPPWEDPVTMAVNAARDLLTDDEKASIGLILVASETGVDQEKSLSTWVQRYLDLPDDCRNCEVKIACYGGTAALFLAMGALSLLPEDKKVLVVTTDVSRTHFGKPYEFVMGCGAVAMLVSRNPRLLAVDPVGSGVFTYEVSDLIRPTSLVEAGHSETSLLSYLEGILQTFERFMDAHPEREQINTLEEFRRRIPYHIYHAPFGGITRRAHKKVHQYFGRLDKEAFAREYDILVAPTLQFNRRMGGTYAASIFISLMGLIEAFGADAAGKDVGIYSYGSGSCAEFFRAQIGDAAKEKPAARLKKDLKARRRLTVAEYEAAEAERLRYVDEGDFKTEQAGFEDWYDAYYKGNNYLVYTGARDYVRQYAWS